MNPSISLPLKDLQISRNKLTKFILPGVSHCDAHVHICRTQTRKVERLLIEIKPDKQPIGNYADAKPFTNHEMDLEKGDVLYTFSDGYPDQFGGPKGKKFMYKQFRNLLLEIHQKPMDDQYKLLHNTFEEWRGDLEQIDDVCIIGVRI